MSAIWKSTVRASRYSRKVTGVLHVQAPTRAEALQLLARLAEVAPGAAGKHARKALSGEYNHTLIVDPFASGWAAPDGTWVQCGPAGRSGPHTVYARWEVTL